MDLELNRRWRERESPFKGVTLTHHRYVSVTTARNCILSMAHILRVDEQREGLYRLDDWHEHDGCLTEPLSLSWPQMVTELSSDQAIESICSDDSYVRLGYFRSQCDFYMRIHVARNGEIVAGHARYAGGSHAEALLDITCSHDMANAVAAIMETSGIAPICRSNAAEFFVLTYRG